MKKNLGGKIRDFVESEEGKVGIKSPLTLGVATGGILLAQAIIGSPVKAAVGDLCKSDNWCDPGEHCGCYVTIQEEVWGTCHD